ncbi:MAG: AAA family ATPase [Archangiaceae bacterium]|nr:AAA family ATPase [Archangiaceae bacterium]
MPSRTATSTLRAPPAQTNASPPRGSSRSAPRAAPSTASLGLTRKAAWSHDGTLDALRALRRAIEAGSPAPTPVAYQFPTTIDAKNAPVVRAFAELWRTAGWPGSVMLTDGTRLPVSKVLGAVKQVEHHQRPVELNDPAPVNTAAMRKSALAEQQRQIELAIASELKPHVDRLLEQARATAQRKWETGGGSFKALLEVELAETLRKGQQKVVKPLLEKFPDQQHAIERLVERACVFSNHGAWRAAQKVDLALGETLEPSRALGPALPAEKAELVKKLARLGSVGDPGDLQLLEQTLATLHVDLLKKLVAKKYSIVVGRDNVANADSHLNGGKGGNGTFVWDSAEGVHSTGPDHDPIISVRTMMRDGKLVLETNVLIHELGHAVDLVLYRAKDGQPLNVEKAFVDAFTEEHPNFTRNYFHTQEEFLAESFARYALDPEEFARKFPRTAKALDKLKLPTPLIDAGAVAELNREMVAHAPVTANPDPSLELSDVEGLNRIRRQQGLPTDPVIFELDGEEAATRALARQLGSELVTGRAPQTPPFGSQAGFVELTADLAANPDVLLNDLAGSVGAVIYVADPSIIGPGSGFMARYADFCARHGNLAPLVLGGDRDSRKPIGAALPTIMRRGITIDPLSEQQLAELVSREVANDGYTLTVEAKTALAARAKGGDYATAMALWSAIKRTQFERKREMVADIADQPNSVGWVLQRDIDDAKMTVKADAWGALDAMTGLTNVKTRIRQLIDGRALDRRREELGLATSGQRRLNMVWPGNPGTGKTTVARLFGQLALEQGLIRRNAVQELGATDLIEGGPAAAMAAFKKGKGGVIFIDEFHQLDPSNNAKGKAIIDLLTPMLTSPEWEDTVFVFAGYPDKIDAMMKADQGLASRLEPVPFDDFSKDELRSIGGDELASRGFQLAPEVLEAFAQRVERMQRTTPYPGNARDVVKTVEQVLAAQSSRLVQAGAIDRLSKKQLTEITLADVVVAPKYTVEDVMNEIERDIVGNDDVKSMLWGLVGVVLRNQQLGKDPLDDVPTAFVLDGPPGSGKTTIARLIGKLFHALEILPSDKVVETTGGKMVGGFLGNSSALATADKAEEARGATLFVDEVASMTTSMEFSQQSIKELLSQMENHRGQFVVVVADYDYNVDKFLAFDSGVPSRFTKRVSTETMTPESATALSLKTLEDRGISLGAAQKKQVAARMPELTALAEFASGRDVRTLDQQLTETQSMAFQVATRAGKSADFDWTKLDKKMIDDAFDAFIAQVKKRPNTSRAASSGEQAMRFATQTRVATAVERDAEAEDLSSEEISFAASMDQVNAQFGALFSADPAEQARQEADPNSDFNQALAAATGVAPEEAVQKAAQLRVKVRKLVEVLEKKQVMKFSYICPFCGRSDSMACHYFSNSQAVKPKGFEYSQSWLVEHSTLGPILETVYEKKQVEKVVEETVLANGKGGGKAGLIVDWV